MAENIKLLAGLQTTQLTKDLVASDGSVLAKAGQIVVIIPQTLASAVVVPSEESKTLAELWDTLSKDGHEHTAYQTALAGYQNELITLTSRFTQLQEQFADFQAQFVTMTSRVTNLEVWASDAGYDSTTTSSSETTS